MYKKTHFPRSFLYEKKTQFFHALRDFMKMHQKIHLYIKHCTILDFWIEKHDKMTQMSFFT